MRDPYAVYARRILKLRRWSRSTPTRRVPSAARSSMRRSSEFVRAWPDELPADPLRDLLRIGRRHFARQAHSAAGLGGVVAALRADRGLVRGGRAAAAGERRADRQRDDGRARARRHPAARSASGPAPTGSRSAATGGSASSTTRPARCPSNGEVASGLSPQLVIEALIAERGGFARVPRRPRRRSCCSCSSRAAIPPAGIEQDPVGAKRDLRRLLDEAAIGVARLIAHFDDPATPYLPVPRPEIAPAFSDYEHLARVGEWRGTEAEP